LTTQETTAATMSPAELTALFDQLKLMRATDPVYEDEQRGVWSLYRYADIRQVLSDPATFSSDLSSMRPPNPEMDRLLKGNFVGTDPPVHRRMRGLATKAFTPRFIAGLEPRIAEVTADLLDAVQGKDRVELVAALSYPLPVIVIAELLGVPAADLPMFRRWAEAIIIQLNQGEGLPTREQNENFTESMTSWAGEINAYLLSHIRQRRSAPRDDLISRLVAAEEDGSRLDEEEIIGFVMLLLLAGHITTTGLLGNAVLCMLENPGTLAEVRKDRALVPGAIEEALRMRPTIMRIPRITTRAVEIGGKPAPPGKELNLWLTSANRDEAAFPEPDRFDVRRDPNRHTAFGHGIHFCLGAPLSRLEVRIALNMLMDRYADIALAPDDPVEFHSSKNILVLKQLPLDVTAA
jgi:cytochrome P450